MTSAVACASKKALGYSFAVRACSQAETPSPDPRRLMKTPSRATLSPKGARALLITAVGVARLDKGASGFLISA
jgi:hypothetical protein